MWIFFCQRELKIIKTNKPRNTSKLIISEGSSYFMASASEAGEGDRILVWFLEAGCRIMDALAYETKREYVVK